VLGAGVLGAGVLGAGEVGAADPPQPARVPNVSPALLLRP
jgi:hypothetical protein